MSLAVVAVFALVAYGIWTYVFSGMVFRPLDGSGDLTPEATGQDLGPTREAPHMEEVLNILLIGTDNRTPGKRGLSDVLMVMTVDRLHKSLKLMSIMRDLYVPIPGHGNAKINSAYSYGGPELAIRTVNENFGLDIEKYAVVDFLGAENIIDAAGGVVVDVPDDALDWLNGQIREENEIIFRSTPPVPYLAKTGVQRLVGRQAVAFARIRKLDSDFQRTARQREVLKALFASFSSQDIVRKTVIVQKGLSFVTTNFTPGEITWLSLEVLPMLGKEIRELRLPTDGDYTVYTGGGWCMVVDRNTVVPKVQEFVWEQTFPFDPYPTIRPPADGGTPTPKPTAAATPTPAPTTGPTPTGAEPTAEGTPTPDVTPDTTPVPTTEPTQEATPTAAASAT